MTAGPSALSQDNLQCPFLGAIGLPPPAPPPPPKALNCPLFTGEPHAKSSVTVFRQKTIAEIARGDVW